MTLPELVQTGRVLAALLGLLWAALWAHVGRIDGSSHEKEGGHMRRAGLSRSTGAAGVGSGSTPPPLPNGVSAAR